MSDSSGSRIEDIQYFPFGESRSDTGTVSMPHKYTSKELDETGLYYYGARYYNPAMGRFVSADIIVPNYSDPQAFNRYSYARNNPLLYKDPTGLFFGIDDILIGAAVGAIIGGTTSAITGGDIGRGMLIGAVSGAVFSGVGNFVGQNITYATVPGGIGPPTAAWAAAGQIGGGVAGGAAAGAAGASISGVKIGPAALVGGISGGFASFGIPNYNLFGNAPIGSIGNRLINSSLTGAAFGGTYAAMTGENIGRGTVRGAIGWAAGEAANMAIGHAFGFVASGFEVPKFQNGAFIYDAPLGGWITFSNVTTGPYSFLDYKYLLPDGREFSYREHELGHTSQAIILGPGYIPAHAASLAVGGIIGVFTGYGIVDGSHRFGLLERFWEPIPAY